MQPQIRLTISVIERSGKRNEQAFSEFPISIGRLPQNDIVIIDECVSRKHCEIFVDMGSIILKDLQSTNGTVINNELVTDYTSLHDQDVIEIGKYRLITSIILAKGV